MEIRDSNGNLLIEGDSVTIIKSLPLKGTNITIKQGTKVKNIHLTDDEGEVECKIDKMKVVLKTMFLRKA